MQHVVEPAIDRQHATLVLQEFTDIDERLSKYLGPTHLVRRDLARMMKDLREKLG